MRQNPSQVKARARKAKREEEGMRDQGLRILARIIARYHVDRNRDFDRRKDSDSERGGNEDG